MTEKLGTENVDLARFMFLWNRVIDSHEPRIKTYAIDTLLSQITSDNRQTHDLALNALKEGLNQFIQKKMEVEFSYVMQKLSERLKDPLLPVFTLESYSELLKIGLAKLIRKRELESVLRILLEYNHRQISEIAHPEGTKQVASDFLRDIADEATLSVLTGYIKEGVPMATIKLVEETLESLDKDQVAEKLLSICTSSDRTARMSVLRVLNRLGKSSVTAIFSLLSNKTIFVREKDSGHLVTDSWCKMRNAIYILGNIPDEETIQVLSLLIKDPDTRVRLQVVKVLEKFGGDEAANVLPDLLVDPDEEVRKSAITSLGLLNNQKCLIPLMEHFRNNSDDKLATLIAIGKVGKKDMTREGYDHRTVRFLLELLSEMEAGIKPLPPKQRDEIHIAAMSILGRIAAPELAEEIEKFIKRKKKGLRGLLTNERLIEAAQHTLKTKRSKSVGTLPPGSDKSVIEDKKLADPVV